MRSSFTRLSQYILRDARPMIFMACEVRCLPPITRRLYPVDFGANLTNAETSSYGLQGARVKSRAWPPACFRTFSTGARVCKEDWPKVSATDASPSQPLNLEPEVSRPDKTVAELGSSPEHIKVSSRSHPEILDSAATREIKVKPVPDEQLPSHRESQRWQLSQWFTRVMDETVPKLVLASQRINSFTGTDYTAIEELRREIKEQEQLVRDRHNALTAAKQSLDNAQHERASSHKELVGLLERKHSWSATDLERYMSLIRSEHLNDQTVQAAKDSVASGEKALEEARARLEKRERTQYHEEQIWSDTIRRNSTWVTFVLMGFNILLLLTNVVILEPWRRRRIVREVKAALDEKSIVAPSVIATEPSPAAVVGPLTFAVATEVETKAVETEVDEVIPPTNATLEELSAPLEPVIEQQTPEVTTATVTEPKQSSSPDAVVSEPMRSFEEMFSLAGLRAFWLDLFSTQAITLRKVDVTTVVLESAAVGAFVVGTIAALLR